MARCLPAVRYGDGAEAGPAVLSGPRPFRRRHAQHSHRASPTPTAASPTIRAEHRAPECVSWLTVGLKIGQVGQRFGVNDMGSIMIEENVISAAGARNRANDAELRRIIQDAGFIPRQRTTLYERYVN